MKIAYLTTTLDETVGWGRYAAGFLAEARKRHAAGDIFQPDPDRLRSKAIRWHQPLMAVADALALKDEFRNADIIHAAIEPAAPLAYLLSRILKKPYVVSVCGTYADLESYSPYVRWLYRLAFRHADRVAVLSKYTLKVFRRGTPNARTSIVYGGFSPPSGTRTAKTLSPERRILSVGAFKPRKGFHTLIEALGILKKNGTRFRSDIVGPIDASQARDPGGRMEYFQRIETRVSELGISDRVTFHGRVPEEALRRFYSDADIFVLPSEHDGKAFEGLGLVYLEALSRGVPAIGCLDSGAEDVIQDGVNGQLVPPGNPEALAGAISEILSDETVWHRLTRAAADSVERFRWKRVGDDMDALYKEAITNYAH
jgi:glycosyltransferase involved in cell wall biosynthesis